MEPFQAKHVLTGINLECLAAILQKKEIHYDLDVYAYVIRQVYWRTGKGFNDYTGLGNEGREYFLKCADKQAVKYGYQVLKINEEDYDMMSSSMHRCK